MEETFRLAVMAILVNNKNEILIGSSPRDGGYKFPQGGLDGGETYLEGIKREVMEELGLELNDEDILEEYNEKVRYYYPNKFNPNTPHVGQEQVVFKIKYNDNMVLIPQDDEFEKLIWIDPKELNKYDTQHRTEAYKKALELCCLL